MCTMACVWRVETIMGTGSVVPPNPDLKPCLVGGTFNVPVESFHWSYDVLIIVGNNSYFNYKTE